ncbi:TetR/AcrR family transcriptional regulator C-terminal domain-containing protein [Kitasatospora sp. CM 4170]|uniref:TetR/AcrR family transcriptional regulator C-terminal domain-containing protein n=1 Tax=Kitasatospora aburaviensis TaxID=67265 RepID=A0ABW1FA94_9ACTN|nr:TetR/AcrR family transcriptional regulator C-terminal domain-containing protein [Kitasatospora sp. CM 4170]WNM45439.1 TetR/AcrR family transcriptional regulator C-terminal domain-containing protein [Kitasatospora sp. CM 4170]
MPSKLDRAQVVDTALRLLDETGLEGLTLRRIATELDVKAPALYWHFANKQALLDEMATEMLRRMTTRPALAPDSWQEALAGTCRVLRRALLGYRDGAKVFSGTRLTDHGHAEGQHAVLGAFTRAGFELGDAVQAFTTGYAYTIGFVIEEQAVQPMPGERAPGYDAGERAAAIDPAYELAAAAGQDLFGGFEQRFERGLAILVAGVEAVLLPPTRLSP